MRSWRERHCAPSAAAVERERCRRERDVAATVAAVVATATAAYSKRSGVIADGATWSAMVAVTTPIRTGCDDLSSGAAAAAAVAATAAASSSGLRTSQCSYVF